MNNPVPQIFIDFLLEVNEKEKLYSIVGRGIKSNGTT